MSAPVPPRRKAWISHRTWTILRRCYPTESPEAVLERAAAMLADADGHLLPNGAIKGGTGRKPKPPDGRQTPRLRPVGPQEAREGPQAPVSAPKSVQRSRSRLDAQIDPQSLNPAPPTRTETP